MILHFNFLKLFLLITLIYYLLPEINAKIVITKYETKINRRSLSIDDKIKNTTTEDESLTTDFTTYNTEDETTTTNVENETTTSDFEYKYMSSDDEYKPITSDIEFETYNYFTRYGPPETTIKNEKTTPTTEDSRDECGPKVNKSCVNKCCNHGKCHDHFIEYSVLIKPNPKCLKINGCDPNYGDCDDEIFGSLTTFSITTTEIEIDTTTTTVIPTDTGDECGSKVNKRCGNNECCNKGNCVNRFLNLLVTAVPNPLCLIKNGCDPNYGECDDEFFDPSPTISTSETEHETSTSATEDETTTTTTEDETTTSATEDETTTTTTEYETTTSTSTENETTTTNIEDEIISSDIEYETITFISEIENITTDIEYESYSEIPEPEPSDTINGGNTKEDECGSNVNKRCDDKCCNNGRCVDHFLSVLISAIPNPLCLKENGCDPDYGDCDDEILS